MAGFVFSSASAQSIDNLVGYWRLNGDGTDLAGGNALVPIGGVSYAPGEINDAAQFDGSVGSRLLAPGRHAYDLTAAGFTVEFWAKDRNVSSEPRYIRADSSGDAEAWEVFHQASTQRIGVSIHHGWSLAAELFSSTAVTDTLYHHIALTYDGIALKLYLDGSLENTLAQGGLQAVVGGGNLGVGNVPVGSSPLQGAIDELRIWNTARTQAEIQAWKDLELPILPVQGSPPGAPASCAATDSDSARVTFTWARTACADGYYVYMDGLFQGSYDNTVTQFSNVPSFGLHRYCVQAFNATGVSDSSCDDGTRVGFLTHWVPSGVAVCTATGTQRFPVTCDDGSGGAIIAWEDLRTSTTSNVDIYAQRLNAFGAPQWTGNGVPICVLAGAQTRPQIVSDGSGGAIIAWFDGRASSTTSTDIFAQRVDGAGNPLWAVGGVSACVVAGAQTFPCIAPDGQGGAIIVWQDLRSGTADVYAQRISAGGTALWNSSGVPVCVAANAQTLPSVVSDGIGGAIVSWADARNDADDVYAQRLDASGAPRWTVDGVAVGSAAGAQSSDRVVADGAGGAFFVWRDARSDPNGDVYAQHADSTGAMLWSAGGLAVCTDSTTQTAPVIAGVGGGEALVLWEDWRNGVDADVYGQRISSGGIASWATNGIPIASGSGNQALTAVPPTSKPTLAVGDGTRGVVAAWTDARTSPARIRCQRITRSGELVWGPDGEEAAPAGSVDQAQPSIASDAVGGVIAAFAANGDIYAMRVAPQGGGYATGVTESSPAAIATSLGPIAPNPFNPRTTISYRVGHASKVRLEVYDVRGRLAAKLVDGFVDAGEHRVEWRGVLDSGGRAASGVYVCRLSTDGRVLGRKFVLLK